MTPNSRSYLNHFTQPDTIVPDLYNPQSLNRYSYVLNNPIRYNDPTGHREACDDGDTCKVQRKYSKLNAVDTWKKIIKDKFDITMSEDSDPHNPNPKAWDVKNLAAITASLNKMDAALNGKLKSLAGGATFKWGEYSNDACGGGGTYCGRTYGTTVEFFTVGQASVRVPNIFHEFGHVLDNSPGMVDVFSHDPGINNSDFLSDAGYLDPLALIDPGMIQHSYSVYTDDASANLIGQQEHWADIFASYAAGNINLAETEGQAMNTFVTGVLAPYIGTP